MSYWVAGQKIRASDLNTITAGNEQGEWTIAANLAIGTPTLINNWTPASGATVAGISHNNGVFTVTAGGIYTISFGVRFSAVSGDKYVFIAGTGTTDTWNKNSMSGTVVNCGVSVTKRIAAGGAIRCYAYSSAGGNAIHEAASDLVTGVTIYRLGP